MEIFGNLDDDLFADEKTKNSLDLEYEVKVCEPCWFYTDSPNFQDNHEDGTDTNRLKSTLDEDDTDRLKSTLDEDDTNRLKFKADYDYFKKDFVSAAEKYEKLIEHFQKCSMYNKRELYEGLSRSLMAIGSDEKSIEYAKKVDESSSNNDQKTVSFALLFDVYLNALQFDEALSMIQNIVMMHQVNSDQWVKLAFCYSVFHQIPIKNVSSLISKEKCFDKLTSKMPNRSVESKEGSKLVAACLIRANAILKNVEATMKGFSKSYNLLYQDAINKDLDSLGIDAKFVSKAVENMTVVGYLSKASKSDEFVDHGSSKYNKDDNLDNDIPLVSCEAFNEKWFQWID